MDFLKKNARSIVVALLAAGVIIAVSSTANNQTEDATNNPQTTQNTEVTEETSEETATTPTETTETSANETPQSATNAAGDRVAASVESSDDVYSTVARTGDNQTVLVRDVMANYITANSTQLSAEQKLFLETSLVDSLPRNNVINPGDVVRIAKTAIETKIAEAKQLDQTALNRWSKYL